MFDRLKRSWRLVQEAWAVLRQDRSLVLFPILSGIASILVLASFAVPVILSIPWNEISGSGARASRDLNLQSNPLYYVLAFLYYLTSYFVIVFFNVALVACVKKRFAGGTPTLQDGISFACGHVGLIFKWSVLSATVGTILKSLEERAGWLGTIVVGLIGLVWSLATMFVAPVLVYEQVGPIEALKRSAAAFRRTWGETVVVNFGMNAVFQLLALPALLVLLGSIMAGIAVMQSSWALGLGFFIGGIAITVLYVLALSVIQSALQGIFLTACYQYATTGVVPSVFSSELVEGAWRPKK